MKTVSTEIDWDLVDFIGLDETLLVMAIKDEAVNAVREMPCSCSLLNHGGFSWVSVPLDSLRRAFPMWSAERFKERIGFVTSAREYLLDDEGDRVLYAFSKEEVAPAFRQAGELAAIRREVK